MELSTACAIPYNLMYTKNVAMTNKLSFQWLLKVDMQKSFCLITLLNFMLSC